LREQTSLLLYVKCRKIEISGSKWVLLSYDRRTNVDSFGYLHQCTKEYIYVIDIERRVKMRYHVFSNQKYTM